MRVQVNGEIRDVPAGSTILALLAELEFIGKRIAVELNGEIAPRSRHALIQLQPDDRVEIVQAIGGG